jgi:hypothetical protein
MGLGWKGRGCRPRSERRAERWGRSRAVRAMWR